MQYELQYVFGSIKFWKPQVHIIILCFETDKLFSPLNSDEKNGNLIN